MSTHDEVVAAATARAAALAARDRGALEALLHPRLRWTTYDGRVLDRAAYLAGNTAGELTWLSQTLEDVDVAVATDAVAVLTAVAVDVVRRGSGPAETFRLRLTQTWLREPGHGWRCLAGHAGPRS
ncbi:nuclear transport factor 2 family protein [Dactylosporangium sp. CS-033363]|uniref:nuclear transport factor 2 family protein n=1 Tax=Dactylosporangium sp. CS-033363 TaxID=3239935 RepID=UPI003D8C15BC